MQSRRKNLWYCLILLIFGGLLIRLAYVTAGKTPATILLVVGIVLICAAMVVFWLNFRE